MSTANMSRIVMLVVPWLSAFFLPKRTFREYGPVAGVAALLVMGMCTLAIPYKWWKVDGGWKGKILNDLSFILGPFFVGTLWIFRYTYGNFKRYAAVNLFMDVLFAYPLNFLFQKLSLYKLTNFKPKYILIFFTCFSFLIYGFQMLRSRAD